MSKILRTTAIAIIITLLLQATCYASAEISVADSALSEDVIDVEDGENNQLTTLVKGKVYRLSYLVSSDDWKISKIKLQVKDVGWITIREGEENNYLKIEKCETEQGKISIRITCKSEDIIALGVIIQNEQTEETKEYIMQVTVTKLAEGHTHEKPWVLIIQKEPNNPENDGNQENPEEPSTPENPDEEEKLIIIDTSGWVFQGVQKVYDGKEYVALVTGLPDYVTPIYQDNTRTNAGSNKAYVTFEVPDGYAVPEGMETELIIDKANIGAIELDKSWMLTNLVNGTIDITMPSNTFPKGVVNCTYEVNGTEVGTSYTITDTGIYSVVAKFSLTDGMKDNYTLETETAKAIYQVNPDMWNNPSYNLYLDAIESADGQKKVEIWFDYTDDKFTTGGVEWNIQYDNDVLELLTKTQGPSMSFMVQREYVEGAESKNNGYGTAVGTYYTNATVGTLVFNVLDENAKDIVINLTNIQANDSNATTIGASQKRPTNGTGIVLNQESNIIGVTLPSVASRNASLPTQENLLDDSIETNDIAVDEQEILLDNVSETNDNSIELSLEETKSNK